MAKQLNVNLAFTADTGKAKAQLQELQRSLSTLMASATKTTNGLGITQDIAEATNEVAKLQAILEQSKSATGGLDLGKFNQSLKQGGMQISDYAKTLSSLGPAGDQAFAQLAKSVIHAEVPLKRTNALLTEFKTTLANTVRWQISSSILHGFMGSVQQAIGYAQDLNESLNNIRIVTGLNTDQMAAFAKEANAAAQALSTTTTEYTNASLIFFQQGLNEQQVKERTDITIKLAQAAGQSVEQTSDQLTAVWNNFAENGTQSLEHYADAMTKLGAVTASSVDEIAGGLEKFASIGPMIGLSFDSAAAALATITATTRQSEEVVGTALKTIFARIQGLNLGETLDDGTNLNKYSAALQAVGISIKDQNGELKAMDDILAEMGSKWETLNKDQQVALAQTVAGVRQYNQLVSLMDNFDFYKQNLLTAQTSDGALSNAADIYAESWEAARDRVTAAAEEIYNQLLNDEFFIDLNNGFAGFLNILSNTIDGLGGLQGVLLVASSLMMKLFGKDMATAIDNWGYNIKLRSKEGIQDILNMRQKAVESLKTMYADNIDTGPTNSVSARAFEADANLADQLLVKEQELLAKGTALTAEKKQEAQYMIQITEQFGQQAIQSAKLLEKTEQQGNELEQQLKNQIRRHNANIPEGGSKIDYKKDIAPQIQNAKQLQIQYSALESAFNKLKAAQSKGLSTETIIQELERMSTEAENAGLDVTSFKTALANLNSGMDVKAALDSIETDMYQIGDAAFEASDEIRTALSGAGMSGQQVDAILDQLYNSWVQQGIITAEVAEKLKNVSVQAEAAGKKIAEMQGPPPTVGQQIVAVGNLLSNVAMSISAVKGLFDTWNNEDMSFGDKLISTFTTLGMIIPLVKSAFDANNRAMLGSVSTSLLAAAGFDTAGISATIAAGGVGALWAALWPIALVAAAVAAAIAILVVAINAISDSYNKDALAAERAEESARNLADAYNTAKTEYEEMVSAMEAYQSARDGLDSLTEGTEAYASALKEANRLALELINTYGLVAGQDYNWEGDELVINDEALERVQKAKEAEVDQAYATSQMANVQAKTARNQSDKTDLIRNVQDQNGIGTGDRVLGGIINGITAGLGVVLAPVTGGLSLVATGLAAANSINADVRAAELDAAINAATKEYRENANLFDTKEVMAEELNINDEELIDALWSNKDAIISLGNDMNAAEAAFELAAQNSANEILSNNETVQNSKNADEVTAAGGKIYGNAYNDAYEEYLSKASDRGWFNAGTEDSKQMMKEYAAAAGLDQLKGYEVTNYTGDGTVEYEYIDDEGKRQVKEITAEEIAATLAATKAAEDLAGAAERLTQEFNNLDASGKAYDQALKSFLSTGNFENVTREEATSLLQEVGGDDGVSKEEATSYLGSRFGTNGILTNEDAKAYGYESAQAMIDAFYEEAQNITTAWESIKLPDNLLGLDDLSLETAQALENAFDKMNIGPLGEKAGQEFTDGLNKMISELDAEQQQQALAALANIDWSSWDALEQADLIMQEFGVDIDTTSQEWVTFAERMRIANRATPDFSRLKDTLIEISGILNDLDFGNIIDDEDYQKLVAYNDEWERFFILQADGTRKFVGDSAEMLAQTRANIEAQREELRIRQETQENFSAAGWGYGEGDNRVTDEEKVWKGREGSDTASAENLKNASGATQEMLELLGYTDERIQEMIDQANSADEQLKATGEAALAQMYDAIYNFSQEDLAAMEVDLDEMMASTAANVADLQGLLDAGQISAEAYGKQLNYLIQTQADSAQSLAELQNTMQIAQEAGATVDYEVYADNLIRLAEEYDNCTKEIEEYQRALANGEDVEAAEEALEVALMIGEAAEKYGLEAKEVEVQARQMAKAYGLSAEEAAKLAVQNQRMNKGMITLAENWKDWSKALKASDKTSLDWADAAVECTAAIADLVGASQDLELPDDFFNTDNMALLEAAIDGDTDAINRLGIAVAAAQVEMLDFNESFADLVMQTMADNGLEIDITLDSTQFDADKALVLQGIDDIKNGVLSAGGEMDAEWVAALNRMALDTGMSVDDMNSLLGSLGVQAKVKTTYVKQPMEVPTYTDVVEPGQKVRYQIGTDPDTQEPIWGEAQGVKKYTVPGEPLKVEGFAAVAQISTEDNPLTAEIESSTTTAGSPHSSGATYTGNRGSVAQSTKDAVKDSKKKSGGGKKDSTKKKEDEIERYHKVNKEIDAINRKMDRAAGAKDAAFGRDKLPYIQQEIDAIDKLIDKHQEYKNEVATNLAADKDKIKGFGFIDENADGILDNWEQVMEEQLRIYNEAAKAYDSGTLSEEAFKEASDKYEEFKKLVEQYEETYELWEEALAKEEELVRERISKELEEITTKVDFEIEIKQRDLDRLERIVDRLSRDTNNMIEIIDKLGEQVNAYGDQSQWYINGIQRIQQNATSEGRELTDEEQRKVWEYQDALEEINDSLEDIIETVENSLLEEFERWNSEIDENISRFDTYSSTLEHYSEIIKLSGRATKDSALLMSLQMQKTSIAMQELNAVYDKYQANLDAQKNVKEKLDLAISSGDAEDIEYWKKQYDEITKTVEKNAEEVAATWQDALQAASDEFDFVVEQTIQKLKDSISEFGLDGLADRYEKAKTINEQYLSDLDKEYELNKLIRQVEGSIDETDNLNAKRELIKLLDEINEKTAEGVKLSQYDLEYMQAEYELELAKLALEEARNAKTSVRLQRGDDGNYSYVYTADQEAIANAEQNYEDKLHAIKTLSQNHIDEMSDLIIQNEQELMEALAAVDRTKFESEEAYQAELNRITEYYYERDTYLRNELNKAVQNMGLVYGDTILGQLENCSTWEQAQDQLKTNTNAAITTMVSAWSKWKSDTETAMSMVGTSSNTLTNTIQTDADKISTATSNLANTIDTQTSNMKKYIDGLIEKIWEWRDEYLAAIRAMQNTNSSFSSNIAYDPNADYSALMGSVDYGSDEYNIYKGYREQKVNDPNYTGKGKNVSTARVDAFLRNGHTLAEIGKKYYTELTEDEWIKYAGFKTGGYTGEWGPEGKLAYLHEKELVLNAKDTQNILNAVDLVRTISQKLDRQAQIAALGFASKANAHNGTNDNQTIQVEQDVTIHAEFPNATDQNEIKEAILGLVNYTAQYVAKR